MDACEAVDTLRFSTSIARFLMFAAVGPVAFFNCSLYLRSSSSRALILPSTAKETVLRMSPRRMLNG